MNELQHRLLGKFLRLKCFEMEEEASRAFWIFLGMLVEIQTASVVSKRGQWMKLLRSRKKMFEIAFPCSINFLGFFCLHLLLESLEVASKYTCSSTKAGLKAGDAMWTLHVWSI